MTVTAASCNGPTAPFCDLHRYLVVVVVPHLPHPLLLELFRQLHLTRVDSVVIVMDRDCFCCTLWSIPLVTNDVLVFSLLGFERNVSFLCKCLNVHGCVIVCLFIYICLCESKYLGRSAFLCRIVSELPL